MGLTKKDIDASFVANGGPRQDDDPVHAEDQLKMLQHLQEKHDVISQLYASCCTVNSIERL
jgi:hypothetical protein